MRAIMVALAALAGAILSGEMSPVEAQQASVSRTPPKRMSIAEFAQDLKRHLESMGYANVTLTPSDNGIAGTATKGGKKLDVLFDEKGQLRVGDRAAGSDVPHTDAP